MGKKPVLGLMGAFWVGLALTGCSETHSSVTQPYQAAPAFSRTGANGGSQSPAWNTPPAPAKSAVGMNNAPGVDPMAKPPAGSDFGRTTDSFSAGRPANSGLQQAGLNPPPPPPPPAVDEFSHTGNAPLPTNDPSTSRFPPPSDGGRMTTNNGSGLLLPPPPPTQPAKFMPPSDPTPAADGNYPLPPPPPAVPTMSKYQGTLPEPAPTPPSPPTPVGPKE